MLVDPNGLFEAILNGLSKVPSAMIAAALLGGPTAIWLIARFTNPPDLARREAEALENLLWICGSCRSLNENRLETCYRCHRLRGSESIPVTLDPGRGGIPEVGVAVGPGRPAERQTAHSWLGAELAGASRPPKRPVEPTAAVVQEAALVADDSTDESADEFADESADILEPMILEPWVKVSRRPAPAQPTGRPRKAKAQGETAPKPKRKPRSRAS